MKKEKKKKRIIEYRQGIVNELQKIERKISGIRKLILNYIKLLHYSYITEI